MNVTPGGIAAIAEGGGLLISVFGYGIVHGRLKQRVLDLEKAKSVQERELKEHAQRLSDGEGDFRVINQKLDFILTGQRDLNVKIDVVDNRLRAHCEERKVE
jgi:hypothetical protein